MTPNRKYIIYCGLVMMDVQCLYFFKKYLMIQAGYFTQSTYFGEFLVLGNTYYCHYLLTLI